MQRLILDFLVRWRWVLGIAAAVSLWASADGFAFTLTPLLVMCLVLDAERGVHRVIAPLPVKRREQMRAWWVIAVVIVPLLMLDPLILGTVFHQLKNVAGAAPIAGSENESINGTYGPFVRVRGDGSLAAQAGGSYIQVLGAVDLPVAAFSTAAQIWTGLGFCAAFFFIPALSAVRLGGRMPRVPQIGAEFLISFLLVFGLTLPFCLPRAPVRIRPWVWAEFAAVPLVVILSFFVSSESIWRWLFMPARFHRAEVAPERDRTAYGFPGASLFFATFVRIPLLFLLAVGLFINYEFWSYSGRGNIENDQLVHVASPLLIGFVGINSASMVSLSLSLRTLRVLPLSTWNLSRMILAPPVFAGLFGAVLICGFDWMYDQSPGGLGTIATTAILVCGFGMLLFALTLHILSATWTVVCAFAVDLLAAMDSILTDRRISALGGACALALAVYLILRGLRHSSAFYRPRREYGQPFAPR